MFVSILLLLFVAAAAEQAAAALPRVERHDLNCGDTFPCPPEIKRRVDFWIKVFRSWRTNQVVFHDTRYPERVYSVKTTRGTCRRKRAAPAVERERKRIKTQLLALARKLEQGRTSFSRREQDLLGLFPSRSAKELRSASKRIRCQQGNRDRFQEALARYGRYKDHILKVLREHNLSEDILYLPFVESAYNPRAYSRVGAAGLWQIMPRTARTLGLQLNATLDERFDPESATWAAARYLRNSTDNLTALARARDPKVTSAQINPFVITSYNYGVSGMRRAIKQIGPDYVQVLRKYRSRSFRTAVRNFYSSFLAARYVARNANKYFKVREINKPLKYSVIALQRPTSVKRIRKVFGVKEDTLKELNPALTRYVWRGWRLIPEGYSLRLPHRDHRWRKQVARLKQLPAEQPQLSGRKYVVQRGDTACGIARIFNVRCRDLIQVNGLGRRALIRVGQKLDIPGKPARKTVVAKAPKPKPVRKAAPPKPAPKTVNKSAKPGAAAPSTGRRPPAEEKWRLAKAKTAATRSDAAGSRPARPTSATGAAAPSRELQPDAVFRTLMENIDIALESGRRNGKHVYSLRVEPEETLGHYADWLGIGGTFRLRKLNSISARGRIKVGQRVKLPLQGDTRRQEFEAKRLEYHRTLVDEFQQHYEVLSVDEYVVKRGDNMWDIAREYELPYWVLTRLNRDNPNPNIGDRLAVPVARARKPSKEPPLSTSG